MESAKCLRLSELVGKAALSLFVDFAVIQGYQEEPNSMHMHCINWNMFMVWL